MERKTVNPGARAPLGLLSRPDLVIAAATLKRVGPVLLGRMAGGQPGPKR